MTPESNLDACRPEGRWLYAWCNSSTRYARLASEQGIADIASLGVAGVLIHDIMDPPSWCTVDRIRALNAAGLGVAFGIGSGGPSRWARFAALASESIALCKRADAPLAFVVLDWEGSWDGHQEEAELCARAILQAHPDATRFLCDVPWWAPLWRWTTKNGQRVKGWTHPHAPTKEFGEVCTGRRYVQAYGAPILGRSLSMLDWARDPTQYASLGNWEIEGCTQLYVRSLADLLPLMLREEHSLHWEYFQMSATARLAFHVASVLAQKGYWGPSAIWRYQESPEGQAAGLKADGIVGPLTTAALGLKPPPGIDWYGAGGE